MKNTVLAPVIALLVLLAVLWTGLFGIARASSVASEKPATSPTQTATSRAQPSGGFTARPSSAPTVSSGRTAPSDRSGTSSSGTSGQSKQTDSRSRDDADVLADGPAPPDPPASRENTSGGGSNQGTGSGTSRQNGQQGTTQRDTRQSTQRETVQRGTTTQTEDDRSFIDRFIDGEDGSGGYSDRSLSNGQSTDGSATARNPEDPSGLSNRGAAALLLVLVLIGAASARR